MLGRSYGGGRSCNPTRGRSVLAGGRSNGGEASNGDRWWVRAKPKRERKTESEVEKEDRGGSARWW